MRSKDPNGRLEDFYRVCYSMDVLDTNGRKGIPRGQIALLFQELVFCRLLIWGPKTK